MRIRSNLAARLALAVLLAAPFAAAAAPAHSGTVEVTPFKVEGLVVGNKWVIDADFAEKHSVPVPAPFELIVPRGDDFLVGSEPAPGGTAMMKFHFITPDKQWMENIQFVPMSIPVGDMDARLQSLANALSKQAFPAAATGAGATGSKIDVMRKIELGPYAAVEVVGRYENQADGLVHLRIVGIPHPDKAESVFIVMNVLAAKVKLEKIEDFAGTRSGNALSTFRYR